MIEVNSICTRRQALKFGAAATAAYSSLLTACVNASKEEPGLVLSPIPTGPHAVGVVEFEFTDEAREEPFHPGSKRRLLAKLYYPAVSGSGKRLNYYSQSQFDLLRSNPSGFTPSLGDDFDMLWTQGLTHSFERAEMATFDNRRPLIVFSHGFWGDVHANVALLEDLASNGYVVMSVAHPYLSSAVLYPNGDVSLGDRKLLEEFTTAVTAEGFSDWSSSPDLETRLAAVRENNQSFVLAPHFLVWRDDLIAAVDALQGANIGSLVDEISASVAFNQTAYMGMSFGACGVSAAHIDKRARCAINLDGLNFDPALFGKNVRVPTLVFNHDIGMVKKESDGHYYPHSEFSYESFSRMGLREEIWRLEVEGARHLDFTDYYLLPDEARATLQSVGILGPVDGPTMHKTITNATKAFLEKFLYQKPREYAASKGYEFEGTQSIDLKYIRDWAAEKI